MKKTMEKQDFIIHNLRVEIDTLRSTITYKDATIATLNSQLESRRGGPELTEMIAKVHEDIEGRYELDSYDKGVIHHLLCQLQ